MLLNIFFEKNGELIAKWPKNSLVSRKNTIFAKNNEQIKNMTYENR